MGRVTHLAGYPVEQYSSPNIGGRMSSHRGLVLHIAQGTYRGTISWQLNPNQQWGDGTEVTTSSTWIVGPNPGEVAQMVDADTVAWCQQSGSRDWLSVELAGYAPNPPTGWQIEACAELLAWAHRTYGVPLVVAADPSGRGLGHHSMDREWLGEEWGHDSCPGAGVINAKAAIVAWAQAIVAGEPAEQEEETMLHGQVPAGDKAIVVPTPWDKSRISFGCDMGRARLRVAEHEVGKGWYITTVDVSDKDPARVDLPERPNIDRRSIMREPVDDADTLDTPVAYLAWWR